MAWKNYIETWSYRQECKYPGVDWWTVGSKALWKAARTFDPGRGVTFQWWLTVNLRNAVASPLRTHRSHAAKLRRVELEHPPGAMDRRFDEADAAIDAAGLQPALDALRPRQAEAIRRLVMDDEPPADVAESWGASRQVVEYARESGLKRLRTALTGEP